MNRDELFEDRLAGAGYLVGAIDEAGDHVTLVEAPVGEVIRIVREALLSEWSVERAAHGIHASHDRGWHFDAEDHAVQDEYRDMARVALSAALGENENDE